MIVAAFISFIGFLLVIHHMSPRWMRRLVGYKGYSDLLMHGTILWMFLGTSTMGLLQAEAAGIMFSLYLRAYAKLLGYERFTTKGWMRWAGALT